MSQAIISKFHRDLTALVRVAKELDKHYEKSFGKSDLDIYIPKFEKLLELYTKKYSGITFKLRQTTEHLSLRLVFPAENFQEAYTVLAQIPGIHSIGAKNFGTVPVGDTSGIQAELQKADPLLHVTYAGEHGQQSLVLEMDHTEERVVLLYTPENIVSPQHAEFLVALQFVLKGKSDLTIRLDQEAMSFGFIDWLSNQERSEWLEDYDPHIGE